MKIDLFVLPSVMRADFTDAFVLTKDEFHTRYPAFVENLEMAGADFDEWYAETYLWDKMSPDLPQVSFDKALACLRERKGTVLFMSESESSRKPCALLYHGRPLSDFVAMADPRELADRIEYEWMESARLFWEENRFMEDGILPEDLYVFDTTLDWIIVFTHESDPALDGTEGGAKSRFCLSFGCE
jgi:hypothetical protein